MSLYVAEHILLHKIWNFNSLDTLTSLRSPQNVELGYHATVEPSKGANTGVDSVKLSVPVIDHQEPLRSPQNDELGYHAAVGPSKGANTGVDPHILKRVTT
jgi:hypothetical protein